MLFFCLGFFLNVFGILIAIIIAIMAILEDTHRKARSQAECVEDAKHPTKLFSEDSMTCWNCGEVVLEVDEVCWNCGEATRKKEMAKVCPTCNLEMPEQAKFCMNCGSKFDEEAT